MHNLLLFLVSFFPTKKSANYYCTIFKNGSQSKSYSNHCCTLTSQYCTYFANDCTIYKRRKNELLNLLASVSMTSSQKGAKKMRKKRKPKRFWTRPGRTGKWWQNFLDNVVILKECIENFRLSKETFTELCDDLRPFLTKSDTTCVMS